MGGGGWGLGGGGVGWWVIGNGMGGGEDGERVGVEGWEWIVDGGGRE